MSRAGGLRPLAGALAATAVSQTGTRISAVSLPWFVLVATGSAALTGLVVLCEMLPYAAVKAFTGPLADHLGPRLVSWTTDVVSATAALAVPLLHTADLLSFRLLLILVAVIGAARGPGDLAKEIMVPEAADRSGVPLERATGLSGTTEQLAAILGPGIGGTLVALLGPLTGLYANALCFVLGSVLVAVALPRAMGRGTSRDATTVRREPCDGAAGKGEGSGYWRRWGEGFLFLRRDRLMLSIAVTLGFTNMLTMGFTAVLLPVWARDSGNGPGAIGLVLGTAGITALCGSLIAAAIAHRMRRRLAFFTGFLLAGAPRFLVLAADAPMWAVLAVFALSGCGGGCLNPILSAVVFERVPRPLLGRVWALGDFVAWAGIPFGGLLAGAAVAGLGLAPALLTCGTAYLLVSSLTGLRPEWREMDRTRARHRTAERVRTAERSGGVTGGRTEAGERADVPPAPFS